MSTAAEQGWIPHPKFPGWLLHEPSGALNLAPLGPGEPDFFEMIRETTDNEDLWDWYQEDLRLFGLSAPSNGFLRQELERRIERACPR